MQISLWLSKENKTQADLARIIKRDRVRAHRIVKKGAKPNDEEMALIVEASGGTVTPYDFYHLPPPGKQKATTESAP